MTSLCTGRERAVHPQHTTAEHNRAEHNRECSRRAPKVGSWVASFFKTNMPYAIASKQCDTARATEGAPTPARPQHTSKTGAENAPMRARACAQSWELGRVFLQNEYAVRDSVQTVRHSEGDGGCTRVHPPTLGLNTRAKQAQQMQTVGARVRPKSKSGSCTPFRRMCRVKSVSNSGQQHDTTGLAVAQG
jgi:hypothetical protein